MTDRFVCIHGHFYQPPRENAWLEAIEIQDSAYPYHDWNERITAECYAANAASRILDERHRIAELVNNYSKISFNFGPTLLAWMEDFAPDTYEAILTADRESMKRFDGHGSAIAQAYGHIILPLANTRDKYTQIYWGIRDFEHRFKRPPEGMWLPETAVDSESLRIMADLGLRFTILAPHQAGSWRTSTAGEWHDLSNGGIDPRRPYRIDLPGGKTMALFFYDGPVARALAFENLLRSGETLAARLRGAFRTDGAADEPQLVHISTDGETYGHHKVNGDMALAYALRILENDTGVRLTNYGEYLEKNPPRHQVRIVERTSWSCVHGVERWRADCGCNSGGHPGWHQAWRKPLRQAMDELRDGLAPLYEKKTARFFDDDPWEARNDYIEVILDRSPASIDRFFKRRHTGPLTPADRVTALKLMEMQRHCLLMYTSCGWFFDEISGIETVQVIQYAGRALQLAGDLFEEELEEPFLQRLTEAKSNLREQGDGRRIYQKWVRPAMLSLHLVGAHYAISSLFSDYPEKGSLFCYTAHRESYRSLEAGRAKIATGRVIITSDVTLETADLSFGVLHMGDHNITCGARIYTSGASCRDLQKVLFEYFERADFPMVLSRLNEYFPGPLYSIKSLFRDEQRRIVDIILQSTVESAISVYRAVYEPNVPLMRFLKDANSKTPRALVAAGELVINHTLREAFQQPETDHEKVAALLEEAHQARIPLEVASLEFALRANLEELSGLFRHRPEDIELLMRLLAGVELVYRLPFDVNLRNVQDIFFGVAQSKLKGFRKQASAGDSGAIEWCRTFERLAEKLLIRLD